LVFEHFKKTDFVVNKKPIEDYIGICHL